MQQKVQAVLGACGWCSGGGGGVCGGWGGGGGGSRAHTNVAASCLATRQAAFCSTSSPTITRITQPWCMHSRARRLLYLQAAPRGRAPHLFAQRPGRRSWAPCAASAGSAWRCLRERWLGGAWPAYSEATTCGVLCATPLRPCALWPAARPRTKIAASTAARGGKQLWVLAPGGRHHLDARGGPERRGSCPHRKSESL